MLARSIDSSLTSLVVNGKNMKKLNFRRRSAGPIWPAAMQLLLSLTLLVAGGCGSSSEKAGGKTAIPRDKQPNGVSSRISKEDARVKLAALNLTYSPLSFAVVTMNGDTLAVQLFLDAGKGCPTSARFVNQIAWA